MNTNFLLLWLLVGSLSLGLGCTSKPKKAPSKTEASQTATTAATATLVTQDKEPKPIEFGPRAILAKGQEGIQITLEDFERSVTRSLFFAPDRVLLLPKPEVPKSAYTGPTRQVQIMRQLVEDALILKEAQGRGILPSDQEIELTLAKDPKLARFTGPKVLTEEGKATPHTLASLGLSRADLHDIARRRLLRVQFDELLLGELTKEEVWGAWQAENEKASVLLVSVPNLPTSAEIDRFLKIQMPRIKSHFQKNKSQYRVPPRAVATLWFLPPKKGQPKPMPGVKQDLSSEQQELLKGFKALQAGKTTISKLTSSLGLLERPNQVITPPEDRRLVAKGKVGEWGLSLGAPRGSYIWKISEIKPSYLPELRRPLQREIASKLMRQGANYLSVSALVQQVKSAMEASAKKPAKSQKTQIKRTLKALQKFPKASPMSSATPLRLRTQGFIPGVGSAPEFSQAIFKTLTPGSVVGPLVKPQKVWLALLLERKLASKKDFERVYDTFRPKYVKQLQGKLLDIRLDQWRQKYDVRMTLDALRQKYGGKYKKKGELN